MNRLNLREPVTPTERYAVQLYRLGAPYGVSTGLCGRLTYGYGQLDEHGYWEFELPVEENPDDQGLSPETMGLPG